jgi:hypothetical protein
MAIIDNIVPITITRQTTVAKVASFNGLLIAAEFLKADITPSFDERVRPYSSLQEIATAGFPVDEPVYLAAEAFFQQNPNPGVIYVGRKLTGIDGSETWTEAMTAIAEADDNWYGFFIGSRTLADLQEVADWAETVKKLFCISDDDANIIGATGDIAEYLETNNYDRSFAMYHPDADLTTDDPYAEAAWSSFMFTYEPGEATWSYKQLSGVSAYELTTAEINTASGKNCNLFQEIAGVDVTRFGTVGSGEYIDIVRGTDWLEARIQERVFTILLNNPKIPFTDGGIQLVVAEVEAALQEAVDVGLIAPPDEEGNNGFNVTYPRAADVDASDKAARLLPDINFTAVYAGAVHKTQINGIISL